MQLSPMNSWKPILRTQWLELITNAERWVGYSLVLGAESLSLSPNLLFFFYCCDQFTRLIYLRKSSRVCLGWRKKHSTTYLVGSKIFLRGNSTCSRNTPRPMQKKKKTSQKSFITHSWNSVYYWMVFLCGQSICCWLFEECSFICFSSILFTLTRLLLSVMGLVLDLILDIFLQHNEVSCNDDHRLFYPGQICDWVRFFFFWIGSSIVVII